VRRGGLSYEVFSEINSSQIRGYALQSVPHYVTRDVEVTMPRENWRRRNPEKAKALSRAAGKRSLVRTRKAVFDLLGDKCVRCGFSDKRALQVDHVNGRRGESGTHTGRYLYRQIILGKLPKEGFQVLCANCNWIKRSENNEVPYYRKKYATT